MDEVQTYGRAVGASCTAIDSWSWGESTSQFIYGCMKHALPACDDACRENISCGHSETVPQYIVFAPDRGIKPYCIERKQKPTWTLSAVACKHPQPTPTSQKPTRYRNDANQVPFRMPTQPTSAHTKHRWQVQTTAQISCSFSLHVISRYQSRVYFRVNPSSSQFQSNTHFAEITPSTDCFDAGANFSHSATRVPFLSPNRSRGVGATTPQPCCRFLEQ